jgi:NAD(P)-dependent dehydrogenase (short-subunit alcohol dehydrogenase family)
LKQIIINFTGIGFETALHLAKMSCKVTIASRNLENSKLAVDKIIELTSNQNVDYFGLDLGSFSSIKTFVKEFTSKYSKLDFLINNSG